MKNIIVLSILIFASTKFFAQTQSNEESKIFANLQTKEMIDFFKLESDKEKRIFNINLTCANKIAALQQDTQMSSNVIQDGVRYNYDLREALVKKELDLKQLDLYPDFQAKSKYNGVK